MYTAPMHLDVLAALRYLRNNGAKTVSVMGGSFGGSAAADASMAMTALTTSTEVISSGAVNA